LLNQQKMAIPLCPYFEKCGGCTAQHIEYTRQLENKKKAVAYSLETENIQVFFDKGYNYRNRMDFLFHETGLGLRVKGKWDTIIDVESCPIAEEKINILLKEVRTQFTNNDAFKLREKQGTLRYCVIRTTPKESSISFVLNKASKKCKEAEEKIKAFVKQTTAENILLVYTDPEQTESISNEYKVLKGKAELETELRGKQFVFPIQGFFQNNTQIAEEMQKYVQERINNKTATLVDLYAGVGCFGIINADRVKEVIIIENHPSASVCAEKNIKLNKLLNATAINGDANKMPRNLKNTIFIVDPPRSGMDEKVIRNIIENKPETIFYISCNHQQLAKDLKRFKEYKIKNAALFDLFPQTPHIEVIVELEKLLTK